MAKPNQKKEGGENDKIASYDKENDILFIHKDFSGDEKFKET